MSRRQVFKHTAMGQAATLVKIKGLRKTRGLSQADMAQALHIALKTYQNIEGGITRIDIERLGQIAAVLDTTLHELLGAEKTQQEVIERLIAEGENPIQQNHSRKRSIY